MHKLRLGIIGSGSGTNMQAIHDAIQKGELNAEIALVMSDEPNAYILERAKNAGIPHQLIDCQGFRNKYPLDSQHATADALLAADVDLVCLAGFMRLVKHPILDVFPKRILNIHPSLLPAFPGLEAWAQAVDAGVDESGCTVHYVDSGMDTGKIIIQKRVPVLADDTAETLHTRIREQEHIAYPEAIIHASRQIF